MVKCWFPHTRCNANITEQKSHHGAVTHKDCSLVAEMGYLDWGGGNRSAWGREQGHDTRAKGGTPQLLWLLHLSHTLWSHLQQRAGRRGSFSHLHIAGGQNAPPSAQGGGEGQPVAGLGQALARGNGKHCGQRSRSSYVRNTARRLSYFPCEQLAGACQGSKFLWRGQGSLKGGLFSGAGGTQGGSSSSELPFATAPPRNYASFIF